MRTLLFLFLLACACPVNLGVPPVEESRPTAKVREGDDPVEPVPMGLVSPEPDAWRVTLPEDVVRPERGDHD